MYHNLCFTSGKLLRINQINEKIFFSKHLNRKDSIRMNLKNNKLNYLEKSRRNILRFFSFSSVILNPLFNVSTYAEEKKNWELIKIPVDTVLFDIDFVKDSSQHGWLVGSKGTFLETNDLKISVFLVMMAGL